MKKMIVILILVVLTGCMSNTCSGKDIEINLNDTTIVGYGIVYGVDSHTQVSIHRDADLKLYIANSSIKTVWGNDDVFTLFVDEVVDIKLYGVGSGVERLDREFFKSYESLGIIEEEIALY